MKTTKKKVKLIDLVEFMPVGNRKVRNAQVKELMKSIEEYGIIRDLVVVKTKLFDIDSKQAKHYIADGQHLFTAASRLNRLDELGIKVVVKEFNNILELVSFISTLNTTQSTWKISDFIDAYSSTHKMPAYTRLKEKRVEYNQQLSYTTLGIIYGVESRRTITDTIKDGSFNIVSGLKGDDVAQLVMGVQDLFGRLNSRSLYHLSYVLAEDFSRERFLKHTFQKYVEDNILTLMKIDSERQMRDALAGYHRDYKGKLTPEFKEKEVKEEAEV